MAATREQQTIDDKMAPNVRAKNMETDATLHLPSSQILQYQEGRQLTIHILILSPASFNILGQCLR